MKIEGHFKGTKNLATKPFLEENGHVTRRKVESGLNVCVPYLFIMIISVYFPLLRNAYILPANSDIGARGPSECSVIEYETSSRTGASAEVIRFLKSSIFN